ncbi:Beta-ketoacyl synthase [Macrophomina phaseolina MS6]|uniref:Beta-ketoacyl synthase n=1 Tax=Macrophomina phaseolina (strain MS6) TaxID=1126212 RepID=K2QTY7_MACPH|nr:Beta-ketoacyl synthase [Macrophomina phaseolina MS6]
MQKQRVPPQAGYRKLNPRLCTIAEHNVVIPTRAMPWKSRSGAPRRALLNNFGAAGSNAALIVEEYPQSPHEPSSQSRSCHVLNLSAKTPEALEKLRSAYCEYAEEHSSDSLLANVCYSTNARKQQYDAVRFSVTAQSMEELATKLRQATVPARLPPSKGTFTTFVFSGQGSVYPGMGAELLSSEPVFDKSVKLCNTMLAELGFPATDALIGHNLDAFGKLMPKEQAVVSQCACFVLEYSLAQVWAAWGVVPDVVVGHSLGEYAALVFSGVLSLRDALFLVARRASLVAELCQEESTGMVACNLPPTEAEGFLSRSGVDTSTTSVACKNSADDCVFAGPLASLKHFVDACKVSGIKAKLLGVPYGFHSAAMDPILEPFAKLASTVQLNSPKIPVASSFLGKLLLEGDITADYFVGHAREPVEFVRATNAIADLAGDKKMTFIEVGPAPITLPMLRATLKQTGAAFLPSLKPREKPWVSLSSTLSSLYLQRSPVQWRNVYAGLVVQFLTDLPRYPLLPSTFLIPFKEAAAKKQTEEDRSPRSLYKFLDGSQKASANGSIFSSSISDLAGFIKSHNVGGAPLCPASVYIELALEALDLAKLDSSQSTRFRTLTDLAFDSPLVYSERRDIRINTELAADGSHFRVLSEGGTLHCTGSILKSADLSITQDFARRTSYIKRQRASVNYVDSFSTRILYDVIFPRVVAYSGPYVTIKHLNIAASGLEGAGTFQIPRSDGVFACPPAFTDTLLHAAGFVANSKIGTDEACICVKVERVTIPQSSPEDETLYNRQLGVYCGLVECSEEDAIIGDAYALDESGNVIACVEGMHFKRLRLKSFQAHLARALNPASPSHQHGRKVALRMRKDSGPGGELQGISAPHSATHAVAMPSNRSLDRESVQSSIRPTLYGSLYDICGIAAGEIGASTRLSEMGVDSLLFIELTAALQQRFPHLNFSGSDFASCETVGDIEKLFETAAAGTSTPQFEIAPANIAPQPVAAPASVDIARIDGFFQEVCGFSLQQVDKDATMDSLGVDSLLSIELVMGLRQTFGIELDQDTISTLTIRELEQALSGGFSSSPAQQTLEQQQQLPTTNDSHGIPPEPKAGGHAPTTILGMDTFPVHLQKADGSGQKSVPIFLFHDGSGLCNVYSRLGKLDCDVYGIFSLDFSHIDRKITTLEALATRYIDQARLMDHDSIILGGMFLSFPLPPYKPRPS